MIVSARLGGSENLAVLYYVTLDDLTRLQVIFGGFVIGEPWTSSKISGLDSRKPHGFDWETRGHMVVLDNRFYTWEVICDVCQYCGQFGISMGWGK